MLTKILKSFGLIVFLLGIFTPAFAFSINKINNTVYLKDIDYKIKETKNYFCIIEIDKINLKREIYPIGNRNNNVNKNIYVLQDSSMPDSNSSNLIIAGHSGYANNAYFKNLYKLNVNDNINLYYKDKIYTYIVSEIEYQKKTGTLYLKHEYNHMLTLITCTKNNKKTQTIYYAKLKNKENIV